MNKGGDDGAAPITTSHRDVKIEDILEISKKSMSSYRAQGGN